MQALVLEPNRELHLRDIEIEETLALTRRADRHP